MIIFLYGPDIYRSKQKLQEIIDHYKKLHPQSLSLLYRNAGSTSVKNCYQEITTLSIFSETKLMILRDVFTSKKFQEELLEFLEALSAMKDVVVIYETESPDQRSKLFKALIKTAKTQAFPLLEGKEVRLWVQKEFEIRGQKIMVDALDTLVAYVGNDLVALSQEIQKVTDYRRGEAIRKADIEMQVRPKMELDIFKTIDALALKDRARALAFLQTHIALGENPLYLFSMIAYQFKNLLMVKELAERGLMYQSIVKKSGLHPFVVKKNYFACQKFSMEELKKIYQSLFAIDTDIKRGALDPEGALELFVARL